MIAPLHLLAWCLAYSPAGAVEIGAQTPPLRLTHADGAPAD